MVYFPIPGVDLQWPAGCDRSRPTDWALPAYGQLDRGCWVQDSPSFSLEAPARGQRGGWLCETSGRVLPGERKRRWLQRMLLFIIVVAFGCNLCLPDKKHFICHTGYHSWGRTHSALRPTSKDIWYDWQVFVLPGLALRHVYATLDSVTCSTDGTHN